MIRLPITLAVLAALGGIAEARDSTWLICKGKYDTPGEPVVVSLLEHRAQDGSSRDLDVTFLFGAHVSQGTVTGKNGSDATTKGNKVKLVDAKGKTIFSGGAVLAQDFKSFSLDGQVDWSFGDDAKAKTDKMTVKFTCEEIVR